jgi:hypothetical protein
LHLATLANGKKASRLKPRLEEVVGGIGVDFMDPFRLKLSAENIIVIYLNRIGSEFLPANFSLSYFAPQFINSAHLFPPIRVYHHFYLYIPLYRPQFFSIV